MDLEKTYIVGDVLGRVTDQARYLVATAGPLEGRYLRLGPEPLLIGRAPDCSVTLPDPAASGRHCVVRVEGESVMVADQRSTNGTFLDGRRLEGRAELRPGSVLQVGRSLFRLELLADAEVRRREQMAEELRKASLYVQSLLPTPLRKGPVRTDWRFIPSLELGGDAFGHHTLADGRFALYLLDVSGHGAGSALHSVSAMSFVRKQSLPGVDFGEPDQVLTALNAAFPMEKHGEVFFTMWYGVFDPASRRLSFSSAGHPPALLVSADRSTVRELRTRNLPVGIAEGVRYSADAVEVPAGSHLYVFSDGTFEVRVASGEMMDPEEFRDLVAAAPREGVPEPERIETAVRERMTGREFEDDF